MPSRSTFLLHFVTGKTVSSILLMTKWLLREMIPQHAILVRRFGDLGAERLEIAVPRDHLLAVHGHRQRITSANADDGLGMTLTKHDADMGEVGSRKPSRVATQIELNQ